MCYLQPIHAEAWQKPTQYCKAIILQLKRNVFLKCSSVHAQAPAPPQSILPIQGSWSLALPPCPALQTRLRILASVLLLLCPSSPSQGSGVKPCAHPEPSLGRDTPLPKSHKMTHELHSTSTPLFPVYLFIDTSTYQNMRASSTQ